MERGKSCYMIVGRIVPGRYSSKIQNAEVFGRYPSKIKNAKC